MPLKGQVIVDDSLKYIKGFIFLSDLLHITEVLVKCYCLLKVYDQRQLQNWHFQKYKLKPLYIGYMSIYICKKLIKFYS